MIETFSSCFVEFIPNQLEEGTLYVSMEHAIAVHLCACGCRSKVVTPLSPINWQLSFDGRAITLTPSIGNHSFACRSHYWIERSRVRWSWKMSQLEVETIRIIDRASRERFYGSDQMDTTSHPAEEPVANRRALKPSLRSALRTLLEKLSSRSRARS